MNILMFGWEFPPHISGGLGTACYGLTHALIKAKVKVLFVVPRLFGSEAGSFLINASAIAPTLASGILSRSRRSASTPANFKHKTVQQNEERITILEVPSYLAPYQNSGEALSGSSSITLRSWNYSLNAEIAVTDIPGPERRAEEHSSSAAVHELFRFTGTYGKNLMDEVSNYAEVALVIASKYSFDAIHAHDWMTFPAGRAAKKKSGKPLIAHVHSTEVDRAGAHINQAIFDVERYGLQHADRIIAVSNWTKQILVSRYDVPEEKVAVVYNGIQPKKQSEAFSFPDIGSHFVTFLGRVTRQKGPLFFVEAAKKVLQEFPDAHFIVAGAGDLLPQTIERVAQLGMSANFHFTGFLSPGEVEQIWSITDVYVMPSVSEPFGIAPLEAIQGGVPVILSNQSGVSEVMPHAIKADFWDIKALAGAICSVLRYDSLSQVLRQNSKKHIESLTWDKAAADIKTLYNELAEKKY